jgi:hypothetical protein
MIGPCFDGIVFAALLWPVGVIQVISQSQMLTTKIDCKFSELQDAVLPLLRGRVFHLADVAALDSFYRRGSIPAGYRGQFAAGLCPAQTSYGAKRGYLCLFDFRVSAKSELEEAFIRHYFIKPFHYGNTYCYLSLAPSAWPKLIPWQHASSEVGTKELYIPFVEAWYPGDLPLDLVNDCLTVTVQPTAGTVREIIGKAQPKATA